MMGIDERIRENRDKIKSIYDLASLCYDFLREKIDNQALFLGKYVAYSHEAAENNPNIPRLRKFSYEIYQLFLQKDKKYFWNEIVGKTLDEIEFVEEKMESYGADTYNKAAIAYHLLQAVDLYAEIRDEGSLSAPVNTQYNENSYVYCCSGNSMLGEAARKLDFRHKIQNTEIRNEFKCLRILEKGELGAGMNPPRLVTLYIDKLDTGRQAVLCGKKLKIVIIPFGQESHVMVEKTQGCLFRVKYIEEHKQDAIKRALQMLGEAIRKNANIIIFPEYICFPEMQNEIGSYLRKTYSKKPKMMKSLLLVIAGSGWTEDDNNVLRVYSYSGKMLGEQYKYAPYDGKDEHKNRLIEQLRNPGKESIIVKIPGIGSFMTAICRDVSNRDRAEKMADVFRTDFVMVSAWSPSLHGGFEKQLGNITETNMVTSSLVCNCCKAIECTENLERGVVVTPCKKGSIVEAEVTMIKSDAAVCQACKGCIFSVLFCFETQNVEKGKIVHRIIQKTF